MIDRSLYENRRNTLGYRTNEMTVCLGDMRRLRSDAKSIPDLTGGPRGDQEQDAENTLENAAGMFSNYTRL